jgi:hypothetical protein
MPEVYTPNRLKQEPPIPPRRDKALVVFLFYLSLLALLAFMQFVSALAK